MYDRSLDLFAPHAPPQVRSLDPNLTRSAEAVPQAPAADLPADIRVCAVDATWSGLLFARRKA